MIKPINFYIIKERRVINMQFAPPECIKCGYFKSTPQKIGGKAKCSKYPNGIPKSIYFQGNKCPKRTSKRGKK